MPPVPFRLPEFYGLCFSRISRAIFSVCLTLPSASQRPLNTVPKTSTRRARLSSIGLSEFCCLSREPEESSASSSPPSRVPRRLRLPDDRPSGWVAGQWEALASWVIRWCLSSGIMRGTTGGLFSISSDGNELRILLGVSGYQCLAGVTKFSW